MQDYPNSEQAVSIAEVLRMEVLRTGGCIRCLERVRSLKKEIFILIPCISRFRSDSGKSIAIISVYS